MTNIEKLGQVTGDVEFMNSLETTTSYEEFKEKFADKGVDIDSLEVNETSEELSAHELENVAGGISAGDLVRIVKASVNIVKKGPVIGAWTFGASYGVLIRAYYDIYAHGSATYSYSEDEIIRAARAVGVQ